MNHFKTGVKVLGIIVVACIIVTSLSVAIPFVVAFLSVIGPFVAGIALLVGLVWIVGALYNAGGFGVKKLRRKIKK